MTVDVDVEVSDKVLIPSVIQCLNNSSHNRILIAVAGVPGSGKSTVANSVSDSLNKSGYKTANGDTIESVVVGMDGFHLPRSALCQMEDSAYAFQRRGAPFTFDADGFVAFVKSLRQSCQTSERSVIKAPSFDHKIKDPTVDDIVIPATANVIIIEGLYLLLNQPPWDQVSQMVDQTWFVKVEPQLARDRLARRHFEAGIEPSLEASYNRIDTNDALNAQLILNNMVEGIDIVIN